MELYFDTAATTPIHDCVRIGLLNHLDTFGNPSSLHRKGIEAEHLLETARTVLKQQLGDGTSRFVFTANGTEANNLAIFGLAERARQSARHAVTTQIEHPSVLACFRVLEARGWDVTYVAPQPSGDVRASDICNAIRSDTAFVSMMHVNNETGTILPVAEVGQALSSNPRVRLHVDGIQAFCKLPASLNTIGADIYTVSGHKIGAPKGIAGALIRQGLQISPFVHGGGQEYGLRSGTENPLFAHAFSVAAHMMRDVEGNFAHVTMLSNVLLQGLSTISNVQVVRPSIVSPYIVSVCFPRLRGEVIVHALEAKGLYVSSGSACSSRNKLKTGSHVLNAMGLPRQSIEGAIRFSLAPWHTTEDVVHACEIVNERVSWLYRV